MPVHRGCEGLKTAMRREIEGLYAIAEIKK